MIGVGVIVGELLAYERIMSAKVVLIISMLFKVAWITLSLPFLITLDAKSAEGYNLSRSIQKILNLGLSDQTNVKTMIIQLNKLETETLDSLRGLLLILLIGGVLIVRLILIFTIVVILNLLLTQTIAITGSITRRSIRFFCLFYTRAEMFKCKLIFSS